MVSAIAIIVVVVVISTIIATIVYLISGRKGKTFLVEYATVITGVSVLLVLATFAYQYIDGQQTDIDERERGRIALTSEAMVDVEKQFSSSYPYLERLYSQIYYPTSPTRDVDDTTKREDLERHMTQILFRHMQSIFDFNGGLSTVWETTDPQSLSLFKRWFSSSIVREQWENTKDIYPDDLQVFVSKQVM
jgi:hypothetical protein